MFTLPDTDTNTNTDTDAIGLQTNFVRQCEHIITDRMGPSPILSVIQPTTFNTMLNNNGLKDVMLINIAGDRLGYRLRLRFMSFTEKGSRDPSPSPCNLKFCIIQCSHRAWNLKSVSVSESGNVNEPLCVNKPFVYHPSASY